VQQGHKLIAPAYHLFLLSAFVRLYFAPAKIENPAKIPTRTKAKGEMLIGLSRNQTR
jgi:hypothetical protein